MVDDKAGVVTLLRPFARGKSGPRSPDAGSEQTKGGTLVQSVHQERSLTAHP